MSLNKSATRRLSLLAGSSIVAASLTFGAAVLAPMAALAANECGNPSTNGSAPDIMTCTPGTYLSGIDYSTTSDGDLTVVLRDRVDTGTSNTAGTGGIRMFGDTGENMTLIREDTASVVGDPRIINTAGRGVDVSTLGDGNIVINLTDGDPTAGEPTTPAATAPAPLRLTGGTDAIRAEAAGTGSVSVVIAETGPPSGASNPRAIIGAGANVGSNGSGIIARSGSGAITVDARGAQMTINATNGGGAIDAQSTSGNVTVTAGVGSASGRLFGIRAQTGGAGTVSVTATSGASATSAAGQAAIDTSAGTGSTLITISGGTVNGGTTGAAIRAVSASTSATSAVSVQVTGGSITGRLDFSGVGAGGVTYNTTAGTGWSASGTTNFTGFNDTVTFGAGAVTAANGSTINFGAGNDSFALNGTAASIMGNDSVVDFGAGNDTFSVGGRLSVTRYLRDVIFGTLTEVTDGLTLNFGAGADTMNVSGTLLVDYTTITGLETLNNSGQIVLGGSRDNSGVADYLGSDEEANDVLSLPGLTTYNGSGGARLLVDVLLSSGSQASCAAAVTLGDCLDLRGATTAGSTLVTANYIGNRARLGGFDPVGVTVVDVAGGTSAAEHFVLDPDSPGYVNDPILGGVIERPGLFRYALRYDPTAQRHALVGLPRREATEHAILAGAAQSIWHLTSGTVTDRHTDLRDGSEAAGVWVRTAGEYTRRDTTTTFSSFGDTFSVDNGYKLYAGAVMAGMDFFHGQRGKFEYVIGGQAGYVSSSFDLDASDSSGRFTGATGGAYASLWGDWLFVDGTFNVNGLSLDYEQPALSSKTTTYLNSIGVSIDAGLRSRLTDASFAEPLLTLAWVRTNFEEISLEGGELEPADAESLRGALGMRLGSTLAGESVSATYFIAGRAWYELEGKNATVVHNPGIDLSIADEFTGAFGEAELGINIFNASGALSGFASTGVKWKDGYSAVDLSLGVRMAW